MNRVVATIELDIALYRFTPAGRETQTQLAAAYEWGEKKEEKEKCSIY